MESERVPRATKRGPAGLGFKTTPDGNYDMDGKRLCNLADPEGKHDAVNLQYLETKLTDKVSKEESAIDATALISQISAEITERIEERVNDVKSFLQIELSLMLEPLNETRLSFKRDLNELINPVQQMTLEYKSEISRVKNLTDDVNKEFQSEIVKFRKSQTNLDQSRTINRLSNEVAELKKYVDINLKRLWSCFYKYHDKASWVRQLSPSMNIDEWYDVILSTPIEREVVGHLVVPLLTAKQEREKNDRDLRELGERSEEYRAAESVYLDAYAKKTEEENAEGREEDRALAEMKKETTTEHTPEKSNKE